MKKLITILVIFSPFLIYSQPTSETELVVNAAGESFEVLSLEDPEELEIAPIIIELQKKLDSLDNKIKGLEKTKETNEKKAILNQKKIYYQNYNNFANSINLINEVNKTYKSISLDRKSAEGYNILISVNNPESDALGFKFSNVIMEILKNKLNTVEDLNNDDKKLFSLGLKKLVSGISNLISPTGLIGSAIQFISGFVPTKVKTALKDPLGVEFINDFKEKINDYRIYYATLDRYNGLFNEDLSNLDSKHRNLEKDIKSYLEKVIAPTKIDLDKPLTNQINQIFNYSESGNRSFNFESYNTNTKVNMVINNLSALKNIVRDLNEYYHDYNEIVNKNFDRNVQLLDKAINLPKAKGEKITELKIRLTELKNGKNDKNGVLLEDGFSNKFKLNITQIISYVSQIN